MKTKIVIFSIIITATFAIAADVTWGPQQMPPPAIISGSGKPVVVSGSASIEDIMKSLTVDGVAPISIHITKNGNKYCVASQYRKPNPLLEK